ncbi:hypothetical protein JMJ77_0006032, partial [Colletotrichum scovillei]
ILSSPLTLETTRTCFVLYTVLKFKDIAATEPACLSEIRSRNSFELLPASPLSE